MNKKARYLYFIIFAITFALFELIQEYIRPNYSGEVAIISYFLGIAPNFLPGIGLPAVLLIIIPELFKSQSCILKHALSVSIWISMIGLIANEFITIITPGRGVFDWHDVLWTLIGGGVFYGVNRLITRRFPVVE